MKLFPSRESLVSDIPAGDGKTANLFLQCTFFLYSILYLRLHHGEELDNVDVSITVLIHLLDHLEDALAVKDDHEVKEPKAKSSSYCKKDFTFRVQKEVEHRCHKQSRLHMLDRLNFFKMSAERG
jgi:hypothetical protein